MSNTGDLISRIYSGFRGVDFRGDEINLKRSPDSLNVWKDYKETDSIRTRPGMRLREAFDGVVYGVFFYKDAMLVHSGDKLYRVKDGVKTVLFSGLNEAPSSSFVFESGWYFKDGKHYLQYDGAIVKEVEGYVPTTTIARKPAGGGTKYEDVNMLTGRRKNTFLADGISTEYVLDGMEIDENFLPIVTVNGEAVTDFTVDYAAGHITFAEAPTAPATDGQDNVVVEFSRTIDGVREKILRCTMIQVFDNRVFFSGNTDYPNTLWHSSLDDPSYVSDLDYYREGIDESNIRGMVAGNNALWVFREPSDAHTTVFYHTPAIDNDYGKIYPSIHSSIATGCIGKAINFNDDIVFFSERGMEGISGDVTTEQVVAHRSTLADRKLITEDGYRDLVLEEWEGYLLAFIGNKVYLADSKSVFSNEGHMEYEWFYWELEEAVTAAKVYHGTLYLGTANGVYTLDDLASNVESWWVTPKDKFGAANKLKTTSKRGCVAEATGDVDVYVKTESTDFEVVGTFENVTDYFVCRIKRKKWKDIQMKFYSKTRFSLETVTLESFIGGFVKR